MWGLPGERHGCGNRPGSGAQSESAEVGRLGQEYWRSGGGGMERLEHWQRCAHRQCLLLWPGCAGENLPGPSLLSKEKEEHLWSTLLRLSASAVPSLPLSVLIAAPISPLYKEGCQSSERVSMLNQGHTAISCCLLQNHAPFPIILCCCPKPNTSARTKYRESGAGWGGVEERKSSRMGVSGVCRAIEGSRTGP